MAKSLQASQNIQTIASKIDTLMSQTANELAEYIIDLGGSGKGSVNSISNDVENMLSSIPEGIRQEILIRALATTAKMMSGGSSCDITVKKTKSASSLWK